jgi:hypothetical protein
MPFDFQKFYNSLDWPERKKVKDIQWELILEGYAKGADFVAKECWFEAIRRFRKEPVANMQSARTNKDTGEGIVQLQTNPSKRP